MDKKDYDDMREGIEYAIEELRAHPPGTRMGMVTLADGEPTAVLITREQAIERHEQALRALDTMYTSGTAHVH